MTKTNWIVVLILVAGCVETDPGIAQKEADEWGKAMGIEGPVVCSKQDSDGDGFVSCTFKDGHGVQAIECATGHGCRVPKIKAAQASEP